MRRISQIVELGGSARPVACCPADMKARQAAKLRELHDALVRAGYASIDQQASALGLSRSTTWHVVKGNHKGSGLSAAVIKRVLRSPQLPDSARAVLNEYIEERLAGGYGHSGGRLRTFRLQLKNSVQLRCSEFASKR